MIIQFSTSFFFFLENMDIKTNLIGTNKMAQYFADKNEQKLQYN